MDIYRNITIGHLFACFRTTGEDADKMDFDTIPILIKEGSV